MVTQVEIEIHADGSFVEKGKQVVTQIEIDWILRMAEDELDHLEKESELDDNCMEDYLYSRVTFERVRDFLADKGE